MLLLSVNKIKESNSYAKYIYSLNWVTFLKWEVLKNFVFSIYTHILSKIAKIMSVLN